MASASPRFSLFCVWWEETGLGDGEGVGEESAPDPGEVERVEVPAERLWQEDTADDQVGFGLGFG